MGLGWRALAPFSSQKTRLDSRPVDYEHLFASRIERTSPCHKATVKSASLQGLST